MPLPRSVLALAACQAVFVTGSVMVVSLSALVGRSLAPDPRWATLPAALMFLAAMVVALPASLLMKRVGRRRAFVLGVAAGGGGALLAAAALGRGSFSLFCAGSALLGVMSGTAQYYRFAAADVVGELERPRAISLVLAGGLAAAFVGPNLANWTRSAVAGPPFVGSFLALALLQVLALALLAGVRLPLPGNAERAASGRPLARVAAQPRYLLAVGAAVAAYGTMNLLMMATPLAMHARGFEFGTTALAIQWHAVGMFAPSFFTGRLIQRYGDQRILAWGCALLAGSAAINLAGASRWHFWLSLSALGIGWNLLFVGASNLLTTTHSAAEKAKAQGFNDLLVFGTVACTALLAGSLYETVGWRAMNAGVLPLLALLLLACIALDRTPVPRAAGRSGP